MHDKQLSRRHVGQDILNFPPSQVDVCELKNSFSFLCLALVVDAVVSKITFFLSFVWFTNKRYWHDC